jgi:hypothetical protein
MAKKRPLGENVQDIMNIVHTVFVPLLNSAVAGHYCSLHSHMYMKLENLWLRGSEMVVVGGGHESWRCQRRCKQRSI